MKKVAKKTRKRDEPVRAARREAHFTRAIASGASFTGITTRDATGRGHSFDNILSSARFKIGPSVSSETVTMLIEAGGR